MIDKLTKEMQLLGSHRHFLDEDAELQKHLETFNGAMINGKEKTFS